MLLISPPSVAHWLQLQATLTRPWLERPSQAKPRQQQHSEHPLHIPPLLFAIMSSYYHLSLMASWESLSESMALAHVLNFKRQVTCHHSPVWMFNVSRHACMFLKELLKDICFLILWELLTLQLQGWPFSPVSTESVWIPYKKNIK